MEILFLDSNPSLHHERFVQLFSILGNVHSTYIDLHQEPPVTKFDLVVFADLDVTVDYATKIKAPKVGVSWAWDLQQTLRNTPTTEGKLKQALSSLDLLIVDSVTVQKIANEFGLRTEQIFRAPYGIDIERYPLRNFRKSNSHKFRLYTNRRWEGLYRPQLLLEMASELYKTGEAFELVMANDGSLREILLKRYSELFENGTCKWLGRISENQNVKELEIADLYVSASKSDGSSLSLLEAMAIGVPPLVTDNASNREWVEDNLTGYLFSCETGLELANKIRNLNLSKALEPKSLKLSHDKILYGANWRLTGENILVKVQEILR